jgi:hypothetical protein
MFYVLQDNQGMQVPFMVSLKWRRPPRSVVLALGQLVGGTILELSFKAGGFDFATECSVFKPFFEGRHPPAHIDVYKTEKQCVHDSLVTFGVKFAHEEPVRVHGEGRLHRAAVKKPCDSLEERLRKGLEGLPNLKTGGLGGRSERAGIQLVMPHVAAFGYDDSSDSQRSGTESDDSSDAFAEQPQTPATPPQPMEVAGLAGLVRAETAAQGCDAE